MYKLSEIKELIKMLDQSSVQELEIQNQEHRILIKKANQPEMLQITPQVMQPAVLQPAVLQPAAMQPAIQAPAVTEVTAPATSEDAKANLHKVVSPMVGTFYRAASPGAKPFVETGSKVTEKTVICIVEAMKLLNDIEAEVKGEIIEILVENGQLVEYGQPLFLVKKD